MKDEIRHKTTGCFKKHQKGTRWKNGSVCLAIMLTICLVISMSLPVTTMGRDKTESEQESVTQTTLDTQNEDGQKKSDEKNDVPQSDIPETGESVEDDSQNDLEENDKEKQDSVESDENTQKNQENSDQTEDNKGKNQETEQEVSEQEKEIGSSETTNQEEETDSNITDQEEENNENSADKEESSEDTAAADKVQEPAVIGLNDTLHYENDAMAVEFHVKGNVKVSAPQEAQEDTEEKADEPAAVTKEDLSMEVVSLPESQPEYQAAEEYAEQTGGEKGVISVAALELNLSYQKQTLDLSDCDITAEITPKAPILEAADSSSNAKKKAKKDDKTKEQTEVSLTALQTENGQETELGTVVIEEKTKTAPVLTVAMNSASPVLLLAATRDANPEFTVQYYANLDVVQTGENGQLTVIDTDKGGNNQGGRLPSNNSDPKTKNLILEGDGNRSSIKTEETLTEVYKEREFNFLTAYELQYINSLKENGNYSLEEIWVLKEGKEATSTSPDDWRCYTNPNQIKFTNNETEANENTILIKENTVLRLVFDPTTANYNNPANFYDYDITDDGRTTWDSTNGQHGINSDSNYTESGAKFAFGNANTGTGLQNESWNGNTLNQYNRSGNGYQGCTFGLVTGLDSNGNIQYASEVNAPKLFNDGNATGKKTIDGYSLKFNRSGDTYTLSGVGGTGLTDLEYFNNPQCGDKTYTHIWTNNFWPMDNNPGRDGLTGNYMDRGKYNGFDGKKLYPPSDDGIAHNNMFGMQYAVQFDLTEDYTGPLEYYFFGDDDMWVFLDGELVCDIGGVHSSVGEYVNLWDYIEKGGAGRHTLSFYYTERGLSGSTCYMQFTLPSVSSATPGQSTGALTVSKTVEGQNADTNNDIFTFTLGLTGSDGSSLTYTYPYVIKKKDGTTKKSGPISNGEKFQLQAGESITINNLPTGTKYTITEEVPDGYVASHNGTVPKDSTAEVAAGTIETGNTANVAYTNTIMPKLPSTGGMGTFRFTFGGILLIALASVIVITGRRRDEHTTA